MCAALYKCIDVRAHAPRYLSHTYKILTCARVAIFFPLESLKYYYYYMFSPACSGPYVVTCFCKIFWTKILAHGDLVWVKVSNCEGRILGGIEKDRRPNSPLDTLRLFF